MDAEAVRWFAANEGITRDDPRYKRLLEDVAHFKAKYGDNAKVDDEESEFDFVSDFEAAETEAEGYRNAAGPEDADEVEDRTKGPTGNELLEALIAANAGWDEGKHPRDHGKFASAPGGRKGPDSGTKADPHLKDGTDLRKDDWWRSPAPKGEGGASAAPAAPRPRAAAPPSRRAPQMRTDRLPSSLMGGGQAARTHDRLNKHLGDWSVEKSVEDLHYIMRSGKPSKDYLTSLVKSARGSGITPQRVVDYFKWRAENYGKKDALTNTLGVIR